MFGTSKYINLSEKLLNIFLKKQGRKVDGLWI